VQQTYADQVQVIGMTGRSDLAAQQAFVDDFELEAFDHMVDPDGAIWSTFNVNSQPAFVFVNDDGTTSTHIGPLGVEGLSAQMEQLISG